MALYDPQQCPQSDATVANPERLDLCTALPVILRAMRDRRLQCYGTEYSSPKYSGPCAVGVCLAPELRARLDEEPNNTFWSMCEQARLACVPGQADDWIALQTSHDHVCLASHRKERAARMDYFKEQVTTLAAKYGVPA